MNPGRLNALQGSSGLVTGASGFIGRAVLRRLPKGSHVFATYWADAGFPEWAASLPADVTPLRVNLSQTGPGLSTPIDWALLLAARVETAQSLVHPLTSLHGIADVTVNSVANLCADQVIHLSSGSVYEGLKGKLHPNRVLRPRLPYSIAKLTAELMFESLVDSPYWNLRFFGAFGPGEPQYKFIRRLVEVFGAGDCQVTVRGDGANLLDPMYIDSAAEALLRFVATPGGSRTLDLCQGEALSVSEFVETAFRSCHPSPEGAELTVLYEGVAHEEMLGQASTVSQQEVVPIHRPPISEALRTYAESMPKGE